MARYNSKQFLERLVWSENGIHSTTYLLGVWLYGFFCDGGCMGLCCEMLNLVVLGQILWFRFRCQFSVMKIGRGNPSLIKKNYYLHSGLLVPIVLWVKVCPRILLENVNGKRHFVIPKQKRTGGSDCSDTDATSHSAGIEPARRPRGPHSLQAWLSTPPRRVQPA